ncbi:MAG TPA: family 2 glycosyl transferase [Eubacteriales bacterium]|nr:family 2 glycosyl transferase [Eubacteriales bacterium]
MRLHSCKRLWIATLAALLALVVLTGCAGQAAEPDTQDAAQSGEGAEPAETAVPTATPEPEKLLTRVEGKSFQIRNTSGEFEPFLIKGVNIGAAKPGYWPGEFGIEESDYLRWFGWIGEMNANTIRVYVTQMPAFYDALLEYNQSAESPLYLLQGIYMNEDLITEYSDAYCNGGELQDIFHSDLKNAVDAVHGNAVIEKLPGNAGGIYTSDVSPYVIGYLPGIEFSADFVIGTNEKNPERVSFTGEYVYTEDASPFEVFLAEAQNLLIGYETEYYGTQRPVAFTNWVTTDPLEHPGEPSPEMEDAVSVDAEHIKATDSFEAGFFASYHVYPYYPDFFSYESKYIDAENPNTYRAYLSELTDYHTMPVLIAEFGIPTSRGETHENVISGFNQGHVEETAQGEMLVSLMTDITDTGCMGGLIFSWQDEWFKRTWNTSEQEEAERRPYWFSVESPEKTFGLLSFDPGETTAVLLDGSADEWNAKSAVTANDDMTLSVVSDEAYVYLLLQTGGGLSGGPYYIAVDTIGGQGNTAYDGRSFERAADFLIVVDGEENSVMLVDPYYDVFQYQYAVQNKLVEPIEHQFDKDSGTFTVISAAMSRQLVLPETGETVPFSAFDAGALHYGVSDPASEAYDSLSDFYAGGGFVEIRIPWLLFNVRDPGTKNIIADWNVTGAVTGETIESFAFGVFRAAGTNSVPFGEYDWEEWDLPTYHERLKKSYYIVQDYFANVG